MLKFLCLVLFSTPIFAGLHPKDYGPVLSEVAEHLHIECSILTGVTDPEIDNLRDGNFDDENIRIKKYNVCLWLHSDALFPSGDGMPTLHGNKNFFKEIAPPKLKGTFVKKCMFCIDETRKSGEKDFTTLAWNLIKCLYRVDPENFLMP